MRHQRARLWGAVIVAVLAVSISSIAPAGAAVVERGTSSARPGRLLVLSLPGVTWSDLEPATVPTLNRLLDESAVADLVTRADRQPAALGAAYVTIGAGTRSGTSSTDGDALEVGERFGNGTAGDAYRQRTGDAPGPGIVQLGIAQINAVNAALLLNSRVGALGDTLRNAGYSRAVIANADHAQPDSPPGGDPFERSAVSALMGSRGILRSGEVGDTLLQTDRYAPFGVRLDGAAVDRAFERVWKPRSVVLVEGSDLERADRYGAYATSAQAAQLRLQALRETDALISRLLAHVDPTHDAVLVVAPTSRPGDRSLTVAALRAPGVVPGLLRTATTRRSGFVSLSDIAPTILNTLGVPVPDSMGGRPMRVGITGGSAGDRRAFLIRANDDGLLRDGLVATTSNVVAWTAIALALGVLLLLGRASWAGRALTWVALALIGFMLATFMVVPLHISQHGGTTGFWTFTLLFAVAFVGFCHVVGRRGPLDPLITALSALVLVLTVDNLSGAHLEFNSVFGYSATIGIRLAGNSNTGFALLGSAAVLLAGLLAWRIAAPKGTWIAVGLLAVVLVAFTPPLFGQDFGGTLAAAPAFLVLAWLLLGYRIRVRTWFAFAAVLVLSGLAVGFIDLLRPADQRTHVGRFFEQVGNRGWSGFATVLQRKGTENAATLTKWVSILVVVVVVAAIVALWTRSPRRLRPVVVAVPTLRPVALSLVVLATLGYGLNDSGIAIPAMMAAVVAAALAALVSNPPASVAVEVAEKTPVSVPTGAPGR